MQIAGKVEGDRPIRSPYDLNRPMHSKSTRLHTIQSGLLSRLKMLKAVFALRPHMVRVNVMPICSREAGAPPPAFRQRLFEAKSERLEQHIADAFEQRDLGRLLDVLRRLSQECGMSEVAEAIGVERTNLYRMLRSGSNPKVGNVLRLLELFEIDVTLATVSRPTEGAAA